MFGWYGNLYFLVAHAVRRRQELAADAASVGLVGRATAASALRELPVIDAAWEFYLNRYISVGWEAGYAPDDVFGGFGELLTARRAELAALRAEVPPEERSRWDSHPPIAARIAAIEAMPDTPVAPDDRPAYVLLPGFDLICRETARDTLDYGDREVVSWDDFTTVSILAQDQAVADLLFRAAERVIAGQATTGRVVNLDTVLRLVARGDGPNLALTAFPDVPPAERPTAFGAAIEAALRVAAVRSGVARWRHSWSGPAELVDRGGAALDLAPTAREASSLVDLDRAWVGLTRLGIDVDSAQLVERTASARGAGIVGGLSDLKVDGEGHDLLILTVGLILVPNRRVAGKGGDRLLRLVRSAPVTELADQNQFIPYEEIAAARLIRRTPLRVELRLNDGRTVTLHETWGGGRLTADSADLLFQAVGSYLEA